MAHSGATFKRGFGLSRPRLLRPDPFAKMKLVAQLEHTRKKWRGLVQRAFSLSLLAVACSAGEGTRDGDAEGDGDFPGDGDGDLPGDGDGDLPGDGDGDLPGDGDGDLGTGGGSGQMGTVGRTGDLFTVTSGDLEMVIDSAFAGRIISFKIAGHETLVQEGEAGAFGSTFWPSPQTWPWLPGPGAALDEDAYSAVLGQNEVTMTSASDAALRITVTKKFAPVAAGILVTYGIRNDDEADEVIAPWEISRLSGGVAFYQPGPGGVVKEDGGTALAPESGGYRWFSYPEAEVNVKHFADGSGWLAAAVPETSGVPPLVVFKEFADVAPGDFAEGEAEIELYGDGSGTFYELEQQGARQTLQQGASLSWQVLWKGMTLAPGSDVSPGSSALIAAVLSLGG